jgi:hypothetical protein
VAARKIPAGNGGRGSFREGPQTGKRETTVRPSQPDKSAALLGLAFDNEDGHTRLTRGKNFVLLGGSQDTHAMMQETAVKVNERLDKSGRRLEDVSVGELRRIVHDVTNAKAP